MDYREYKIRCIGEAKEIITWKLWECDAEGIEETEMGISAFFPLNQIAHEKILALIETWGGTLEDTLQHGETNWNAAWESSFTPVMAGSDICIRAPFHPPQKDIKTEIIIQPKMSFGTGHHETTRLVLQLMQKIPLQQKKILDFGCGTGVLGIYALLQGAAQVTGLDIDDWAAENAPENVALNKVQNFQFIQGGLPMVKSQQFDGILANINRNILMDSMELFQKLLVTDGWLLISGFLNEDEKILLNAAGKCQFAPQAILQENQWSAIGLLRKN